MKQLFIFDLDNTLTNSKSDLDSEMSGLLCELLKIVRIGVISGASFEQINKQFLSKLSAGSSLEKLCIAPLNGAELRAWNNNSWNIIYSKVMTNDEKKKIKDAFNEAVKQSGVKLEHVEDNGKIIEESHGVVVEDRGSQITFSALGQDAPLSEKAIWDPDHKKRRAIAEILEKILPDYVIKVAGTTSIDVTQKGIDKTFGTLNIAKHFGVNASGILYIGDSVYLEGNDRAVFESGIETLAVEGLPETRQFISKLLQEAV